VRPRCCMMATVRASFVSKPYCRLRMAAWRMRLGGMASTCRRDCHDRSSGRNSGASAIFSSVCASPVHSIGFSVYLNLGHRADGAVPATFSNAALPHLRLAIGLLFSLQPTAAMERFVADKTCIADVGQMRRQAAPPVCALVQVT
jgi:hypothetical protein